MARLKAAELQTAVKSSLSDWGNVQAYEDGLVVVSDRVEVLGRVGELLDGIEAAPSGGFVVQLFVMSLSREAQRNLGVDVTPMAAAAAQVGGGTGQAAQNMIAGKAGLTAALNATQSRADVRILGKPLMLLADGASAELRRGRQDPIPERSVSPEGTVTTLKYSTVQTGFVVECSVRRVDAQRVRLVVFVELSDVIGKVDQAPIVRNESGKSEMIVDLNSPGLVLSLEREQADRRNDGIFLLNPSSLDQNDLLQVWAHVVPVGGKGGDAK